MASDLLFQPMEICGVKLQHRVVMAPLTRFRADTNHVPLPMALEYYTQRASSPGTLIIAEATFPSLRHCGGPNAPGIWSEDQMSRWKEIVHAVHAKGCYMFMQFCAPGRAAADGFNCVAPSPLSLTADSSVPAEMAEAEIQDCISDFVTAAENAIAVGFDGVEIHGANGYLIDQFTQLNSNVRTDSWGGSVENRSRFGLEVARAVGDAIGRHRVGYRVSPWSNFQGMRMQDPKPQFSNLVQGLRDLNLGYLHVIESRVNNIEDVEKTEGIDFLLDIWGTESPALVAGGFNASNVKHELEQYSKFRVAIVFGRSFVSTPDLVYRLRHNIAPNKPDRATFYAPGESKGYVDYPFSEEFLASK